MNAATPVGGRENELHRLEAFLAELSHGPATMLITGEAGIGKTTLWRAGLAKAEGMGTRLLVTRCTEVELPYAFGGLGDLLDAVGDEVLSELSYTHRNAIAVALGQEDSVGSPADSIALPRAVSAAFRLMADRAPTLIALDDLRWLDPASRRVLGFALNRSGDARLGVLATRRDEDDSFDPPHSSDRIEVLKVGPLSFDAMRHVVRSRVRSTLSRSTLTHIYEMSGGNPMFALEFARSIDEQGATYSGGSPLPLPRSLEALVDERFRGLPDQVRVFLGLISAMERPTTALLRRLSDQPPDHLLDLAVSAQTIIVDVDGAIRFRHPLLASAAYSSLTPSSRRAMHAKIASITDDIVSRGRHVSLARDEPDAVAADILDQSAKMAAARGAPDAAAELARRAVELTPAGDHQSREDRMLAVAEYLCNGLEMAAATVWIDGMLSEGLSPQGRVRALLLRFEAEHDVPKRGRLVAQALADAGGDAALRARVLLAASLHQRNQQDLVSAEATAARALAAAEEYGDPTLIATALSTLAARMTSPDLELVERAIAMGDIHGLLPRTTPPRVVLGEMLLVHNGQHLVARPILEDELGRLQRLGREYERRRVVTLLGYVELMAGSWHQADKYFEEAFELSVDAGHQREEALLFEPRSRLAAYRGRVDDARQLAGQGITYGDRHWRAVAETNRWVLGHLELAIGNPQRAWELLASVRAAIDLDWAVLDVPEAVDVLSALGRHEEARTLLTRYEDRWIEHRWAVHAAMRCRGATFLALGDPERALQAAEDASAGFEADGYPFDQARSVLLAGEVLRRRGERRRATERLELAKEMFGTIGAHLWFDRTTQELTLANPRPRNSRNLTKAEQNVAGLVALGQTNREVAAQLFISVPTVEAHLTRIYRKLGIRSRTQLARRVADGDVRLEISTPD